MTGMDFIQMTGQERIITISVLGGILLIALIADRVSKWKKNRNRRSF